MSNPLIGCCSFSQYECTEAEDSAVSIPLIGCCSFSQYERTEAKDSAVSNPMIGCCSFSQYERTEAEDSAVANLQSQYHLNDVDLHQSRGEMVSQMVHTLPKCRLLCEVDYESMPSFSIFRCSL